LRQQTIANGWTLRTDVDRDAGALDECGEASDGDTVRLSEAKNEGRFGLALQCPQMAQSCAA